MKTTQFYLLVLCGILSGASVQAQVRWYSPMEADFPVIHGQGWPKELKGSYFRLPSRAENKVRKPLWDLSQQSAGLSIVFRSNAPEIKVHYGVRGGLSMPHMPATGVSGLDLYATDANGQERWCRGQYEFGDTVRCSFGGLSYAIDLVQGYEYELFLPLYNQVSWLEIGVDEGADFRLLPVSQQQPIVIYGTSIAQGACALRPGMAWTNIVRREMGHPVVNLGFSGNGVLEEELFELLSEIDAKLYIIDCMPNLPGEKAGLIYDRMLKGIHMLRGRSGAPILLAEHAGYTNEFSSDSTENAYRAANIELRRVYETLQREGIGELYYITKEEFGLTMDAMVDGVHPSDLGMQQYADSYVRKIRDIFCENASGPTSCTPCTQQRDPYDWRGRHEQILTMNREQPADILMIGNSITHFWGGEPVGFNQFGKAVWDKLFEEKSVRNLGFGWDRTENVLWRIFHGELDGYQAKKIFLLIGTNNLASNTDKEVVQGIVAVVKAICQRQPEAEVCVLGILPRSGEEARIREVNAAVMRALQEDEVICLDVSPGLTNKKGTIIPELFLDGLHPNEQGYTRIAEVLVRYL